MKKLLLILTLVPALCMCDTTRSEPLITLTFLYKNESSRTLTMNSYASELRDREWVGGENRSFPIPQGEEIEIIVIYSPVFISSDEPLHWSGYAGDRDSTIVSNGEKQIIYRYWEGDALYFKENYTLVSQGKNEATYRYTFTDSHFDDAEPI